MDDYDVSLGVPTAANANSVGARQPKQQKKQEEQKKKKPDKKRSADSQDLAIISGQTLKPNTTEPKDPSGKGDFIDIQV